MIIWIISIQAIIFNTFSALINTLNHCKLSSHDSVSYVLNENYYVSTDDEKKPTYIKKYWRFKRKICHVLKLFEIMNLSFIKHSHILCCMHSLSISTYGIRFLLLLKCESLVKYTCFHYYYHYVFVLFQFICFRQKKILHFYI